MNTLLRFCLITAIFFFIGDVSAISQLKVTVNMNSRPDPYISNWAQKKDVVIVTVVNGTGSDVSAKFNCIINKDGAYLANTKPDKMAILSIPPGVSQYFGEDLVPLEAMDVKNGTDQTVTKTGMLPAGNYEFCVSLINASTNAIISQPVCKNFAMKSYQAPILLLPIDKNNIAFGTRPMFRWTPVVPRPSFAISYRLQVFEVLEGQTPINAFRTNRPIMDLPDISNTQLLWPADFELPRIGQQYIWTVRATDEQGSPIGEPDGYATPFTLNCIKEVKSTDTVKKSLVINDSTQNNKLDSNSEDTGNGGTEKSMVSGGNGVDSNNIDPNPSGQNCGSCSAVVSINDTVAGTQNLAVNDSLSIGLFTMKVTTITSADPASASGKGVINIPWLLANVQVVFENIVVNASKRVVSGKVNGEIDPTAPPYPQQWAINQVSSWNWVNNSVAAIDGWVKANGQLVKQVNNLNVPLKLPLGFNNVKGYTICISEMKFLPTEALMASVATIPIAKLDDTLSFGLKQVPICPAGISKSGRLELLQDIDIRGITSGQPTFTIFARAKSGTRPGCYITWGCDNNSDTLSLDIDIAFPRDWMTPRPDLDSTKQSIVTLHGKAIDWKEWMLTGNLVSSTFTGTNGLGLKINNMTFDFSDLENTSGMLFPPNFAGATDITFNGFYAQEITFFMPDGWRTFADSNAAPEFSAFNMIITKNGLTGTFIAANVVMFPYMNLNRLGASVDTVKVIMLNSALNQAYMRGRLLLPISDSSAQNAVTYKALFNNVGKSFDFSLQPQSDIQMKLFGNAKLKIESTSSLTMNLKKGHKKFLFNLNGELGWNDATLQIGQKSITLDLSPEFENMRISYDDSLSTPFNYSAGDWSFASPQKKISKFPISIDKVKFGTEAIQGNELFRGKLGFDVVLALDSNRIGGRGSFEVIGAIEKTNSTANFKFKPKFVDFNMGQVSLFATLPAVKMNGTLTYYNNDIKWGNGFAATIQAKFAEIQLQLDAEARFGSKVDNNVRYRYWLVGAKAILPPPGIVFLPGYAFYGFGVAAWHKVNVDMLQSQPNINSVANASTSNSSPVSGAIMNPDRNIAFGFKALGILGTSPDPKKMNCDISIFGQFNNTGGMSYIGLDGQLWLQAKLLERNNAPVKGTLNIIYDFTSKVFDMNAGVLVNKTPITGTANLNMHIEGKTGNWHVKLGDPNHRNNLTVNALGKNIVSNSYFMFGKNIEPPTDFTLFTRNGLISAGCTGLAPSGEGTSNAVAGNGFAGGVDIGFDSGNKSKKLIGRLSADWHFAGGLEFNASFLRYPDGTLCGYNGYNNWYFRANAAAWALASAGIAVAPKSGAIYCKNGCDFPIVDIKFGLWAEAGFPNPSWIIGEASADYDLLGGIFKGKFQADVNVGTVCKPSAPIETTIASQDIASEQKNQLVKSISPAIPATNVPLTESVKVLYNFVPGESFELQEMSGGASGNSISRTFQVNYSVEIEEKNAGIWKPLALQSTKDALGAFLFRKKKVSIINTTIASGNAIIANKVTLPNQSGTSTNTIQVGGIQFTTNTFPKNVTTPQNTNSALANMNQITTAKPPNTSNQPTDSDNFSFNNTGAQNFISNTSDWENSKIYRVKATGVLREFVGNQWIIAKDRASNQEIKQIVTQTFSTPLDPVVVKVEYNKKH